MTPPDEGTRPPVSAPPVAPRHPPWSSLSLPAKAFRAAHVVWGVFGMASLGYIWACALTGRRDRLLVASSAFLSAEGVALIIGRGNCPFGPFQRQLGDPVPMFELVLPPRAAKAAIPILTVVSLAGMGIAGVRWLLALGARGA